ncbi:hypothetical protein NPIL_268081 [Nephila pilipes]|uniref:Uncharacterized protein n=1 Tax=Nephila pilipes TaxID=299642 RepID=A0A8X6UQK8_NEPPI|nr:hypothetical protein NPIL_268081 [Nephila pilipes]
MCSLPTMPLCGRYHLTTDAALTSDVAVWMSRLQCLLQQQPFIGSSIFPREGNQPCAFDTGTAVWLSGGRLSGEYAVIFPGIAMQRTGEYREERNYPKAICG